MGRRRAERTGGGWSRRRGARAAAGAGVAALVLLGACTGAGDGDGTTEAGGTGGGGDLVTGDGLPAVMAELDEAVGGEPSRYAEAAIYPQYAIIEAQDPEAPDHIDRYTWRDGQVSPPEPVHLTGPQEEVDLQLFPETNLPWADLAEWAVRAEEATETAEPVAIEDPAAGYIIVRRGYADDRPITVSVYVTGPRRSGYVQFSVDGEILSTHVS